MSWKTCKFCELRKPLNGFPVLVDDRCIRYLNVPGYCTMVVDPDDSCCRKPLCPELQTLQTPTGTPTAGPELTPTGNTPSLAPGTGPVPTSNTRVTPAPKPVGQYKKPDRSSLS